ncbi:hypothetical protein [Streptomyces albireticuli]|nr:hypothetical protein [Streptomyces albireticuli]MCD9196052.1 hypothetical protein [Streptomyces albireticuli]
MAFFKRGSKPSGHRPSDDEVRAAAAALNAGDQGPADRLVAESGDYSQETAMRVLSMSVEV